jgi:hypothetical protein
MIKRHLNTMTTDESFGFSINPPFGLLLEEFDLPTESIGITEERIRERAKFAQAFSQALQVVKPTATTWGLAPDSTLLATENILLRKEINAIKQQLDELSRKIPEEKVIVLRGISREEAKQEIRELFTDDRTFYYSDIAEELQLDLKLVVEICHELEETGEITVDADV